VGGALTSAGMHAAVGGLFSMAGGGKFSSGFLAAGFSDMAGNSADAGSTNAFDLSKHALVGGVGSLLASPCPAEAEQNSRRSTAGTNPQTGVICVHTSSDSIARLD